MDADDRSAELECNVKSDFLPKSEETAFRQFLLCHLQPGMAAPKNIIGPTVQSIRFHKGWTQSMLTARCNRIGWDIGENIIAKIESQFRCVTDAEIVYLAKALGVKLHEVFPKEPLKQISR